MTGEPTHTASKERMAPELMFSSERVRQLSKTALKTGADPGGGGGGGGFKGFHGTSLLKEPLLL